MATDTAARLEELSAALADGAFDALPDYIAPRFWSYIPADDEPTATERITRFVTDLQRAMSDLTVTIAGVAETDEGYSATLTLDGTHDGVLWGSPGSGKHITWEANISLKPIEDAFAFRFEDLPVPEVLGLLRQFGMVNPPDQMDRAPLYPVSPPEFLLKVIFTGQAGDKDCPHLDQIQVTEPSTRMCAQCFEAGDYWPALRMCMSCGFVGCCDTSKNTHMKKHYEETGHPLMRSIRMDEGWMFCYEDGAFFETATLDKYR
jgi:predicted ester cyclase